MPAKYATLEKAVGFEILFMCVTPGKKTKSIYEMMPGDVPGEALDEFKRLQGSYESPHHAYMMSKDGVRELFYTQLRTGILDISRYVAPSQGSTKRPFPFPDRASLKTTRIRKRLTSELRPAPTTPVNLPVCTGPSSALRHAQKGKAAH